MDDHKQNDLITLPIDYNISSDQTREESMAAINDDINYTINDKYIGYDANQYQPVRIIYGDNIQYVKSKLNQQKGEIFHETTIKIQSENISFISQRGLSKLIRSLNIKNTTKLIQRGMEYIPIIHQDYMIAAIFKYNVPANNHQL